MSIPSLSLTGKLTLVTGGRRGIGRAIALGFAEAGSDIAVCDRVVADGELAAVADEIQGLGRRALAVQADVTEKSQVESLVKKVVAELGDIDILVNNTGILTSTPVLEMSEDDWDLIIDTNLKSYYLCAQAVVKGMIKRQMGVIINLASRAGFRAGQSVYSVSKAGVVMLTRVMSQGLQDRGVRVNGIGPSVVKTDMTHGIFWQDPEDTVSSGTTGEVRPLLETDDVIGAALFLASDASKRISGQTIVIGGADIG